MLMQESVLGELQSIVGAEYAYVPEGRLFSIEGLDPRVVVKPGSCEEVVSILRYADRADISVIPTSDEFMLVAGNVPSRYDVALCLHRLNKIIEYEPADMTITCEAGMTVGELNSHLEGNGQMVAFGSAPLDVCSVGGLLAWDWSGLRLAYGGPRDFTIGLRVVMADGRITRAGGKVVKNVAGYDLCKLYIGSQGTLGVIIEATFKVVPLPELQWGTALNFSSTGEACEFALELGKRHLCLEQVRLQRCIEIHEERVVSSNRHILCIDLAGSAAAVERSKRELEPLMKARLLENSQVHSPPDASRRIASWAQLAPLACRIHVLPTNVQSAIKAIEAEQPAAMLDVSPIEGIINATWRLDATTTAEEALVKRLRGIARSLGGNLVVVGCDPELKRRIDVFGELPPKALDLMRRIKQQFDPNGILSPGRFVGWL
jgi:glycolate dehydrogenase FAD-binding subunit